MPVSAIEFKAVDKMVNMVRVFINNKEYLLRTGAASYVDFDLVYAVVQNNV